MKVTIQRKALAALATQAASVADPKSSMVILGMAVLHVEDDRLHIAATDMYTSIQGSAVCVVEEPGYPVAVPAKQLKDVVAKMPEGEVALELEGAKLRLKSRRSRYHLPTTSAADAPPIPVAPKEGVDVNLAELSRALEGAAPAMSRDDTRPHMAGVQVLVGEREIRASATDGHRVHRCEVPHREGELPEMLLPPKGVEELRRLGKGTAQMAVADGRLFATHEETTLVVKLTAERFPPLDRVIPKQAKWKTRVPREDFLEAVRRASIVANDHSALGLSMVQGALVITAQDTDGSGGVEELPVHCEEGVELGINAGYLVDGLSRCDADEIELWVNGELEPVSIRAEGYLAVIMPMKL